MKHLDYTEVVEKVLKQLPTGAFLTTKAEDDLNVMTIGWGMIGFVWNKPVFAIQVRPTRYTFGLIEKAADFTVSFPTQDLQKQLAFCGTKSGKDVNKFKECNLKTTNSQKVNSPIIEVPGIHFECKIICRTPLDPKKLDSSLENLYPGKDYHTVYYGEIVGCYTL